MPMNEALSMMSTEILSLVSYILSASLLTFTLIGIFIGN